MSFVPKSSLTVSALLIGLLGPIFMQKVILLGAGVTYVLFDLLNVTPSQQGFDYRATSPYSTAVAYGHATCSRALSNNDCANCLVSAKATLESKCGGRLGGQMELVDCAMRFDNYYF